MHNRRPALLLCLLTACPGDVPQTTDDPGATTSASEPDPSGASSLSNSDTGDDPTTGTSTAPPVTTANLDDTGEPDSTTDDTSSTTGDDTSSTTGEPAICGDGVPGPGEQCDDGDADDADACKSDCTFGPGGESIPVPSLGPNGTFYCLTPAGDGLVLGGREREFDVDIGEDNEWAHVQHVPLPDGAPTTWSYAEKAGVNGRMALEAATAANGDVIIGGLIYTEIQQVDTGGYLWLARFTAAGELVWSRDYDDDGLYFGPTDLEVSPSGRIAVTGWSWGFIAKVSTVAVFDEHGELEWDLYEDADIDEINSYDGLTLGADDTVYVAGSQFRYDAEFKHVDHRVRVRAFSKTGAPLWTTHGDVLDPLYTMGADIVRTTDDRLIVAADLLDPEIVAPTAQLRLGALSTAGDVQWWKDWTPDPGPSVPALLLPADDDGFYLGANTNPGDNDHTTLLTRFTADGAATWTKTTSGYMRDATFAADEIHVLTQSTLTVFAP